MVHKVSVACEVRTEVRETNFSENEKHAAFNFRSKRRQNTEQRRHTFLFSENYPERVFIQL